MKKAFLKTYFFFILIALFSIPNMGWAEFWLPQNRLLEKNLLSFEWENNFHYSDSNFDSRGALQNLNSQGWISFLKYKWGLSYSPFKWLILSPYISSGSLFVLSQSRISTSLFQFLESGIKLRGFMPSKIITFSPELDFSYPLEFPQSPLFLSDKAIKISPSLTFYLSFMNQFQPFLRVGYQYRDFGLSHLLIYQVGILYQDRVWQIGALLGSFYSLISDELNRNRHQLLDQHNLGSLKFYSENPRSTNISLWINLRMSKNFQILTGYSTNFMGANYAHDHSFALNFQYRLIKRASLPQRRNRNFQEKSENIESILNDSFDSELSQEIENF